MNRQSDAAQKCSSSFGIFAEVLFGSTLSFILNEMTMTLKGFDRIVLRLD